MFKKTTQNEKQVLVFSLKRFYFEPRNFEKKIESAVTFILYNGNVCKSILFLNGSESKNSFLISYFTKNYDLFEKMAKNPFFFFFSSSFL